METSLKSVSDFFEFVSTTEMSQSWKTSFVSSRCKSVDYSAVKAYENSLAGIAIKTVRVIATFHLNVSR